LSEEKIWGTVEQSDCEILPDHELVVLSAFPCIRGVELLVALCDAKMGMVADVLSLALCMTILGQRLINYPSTKQT
jgi:hypothetical protein